MSREYQIWELAIHILRSCVYLSLLYNGGDKPKPWHAYKHNFQNYGLYVL